MGITSSYQIFNYNNRKFNSYSKNRFGIEFGASYDISGKNIGFRPSIQFDYAKVSLKNTYKNGKTENKTITTTTPVMATELGLAYYVTSNFAYIASAIIDLRSKNKIIQTDHSNTEGKPNNYYGIDLLYKTS